MSQKFTSRKSITQRSTPAASQSFQPTHTLVSRSRRLPVQLVSGRDRHWVVTEQDWQKGGEPAFQLHPKLGFFCRGIQVLGYRLEPLESEAQSSSSSEKTALNQASV
jgi:hypothetical protein